MGPRAAHAAHVLGIWAVAAGDDSAELNAWTDISWGRPSPERASAFLNCEGLSAEHAFWPVFRSALKTEGIMGQTTLDLAVRKWGEWEVVQDQMSESGQFSGDFILTVPLLNYLNGTDVQLRMNGLIDLPLIFQKAAFAHLFTDPPNWNASEYAGFLSCPIGFVLVQYAIFIANKVRANLDYSLLKEYWEGMVNAFGQGYGLPSYFLDHSESADWGITSWDIVVNLNVQPGQYYRSYEEYLEEHPVPPPRLTDWWQDAPALDTAVWNANEFCPKIAVALIGEHGPVNMDHLSTVTAALESACERVEVEAGHFFTYLWALEGTAQGDQLRASLQISWEAFWGEPLTKSQGRSDAMARWSVQGAVRQLRSWAWRNKFLRRAGLLVCCEPLWLCVLMHAAVGASRLLVRVSMCLLHSFLQVFGEQELPEFWPLVRQMALEMQPQGTISAAARISAEMLNFQAGIRPPYVPALCLHVSQAATYSPRSSDVLLFRFRLPSAPAFIRVIQMLSEEARSSGIAVPRVVVMDAAKKSLSFQEIGHYRLLALLPHVPYAQRLPDVFALGSPTLVPALPLLHKFMWPFAGPFCGRTDPELSRSVDPIAGNCSYPFSPFDFQREVFSPEGFEEDRRYWAQYTEWEIWPHLVRFKSAREMLQLASTISEADAWEISHKMRAHHQLLRKSSLDYWRKAMAVAVA